MTSASIDDVTIIAEPDHVYPWEGLTRKLDEHAEEDRTFRTAIEARVLGVEGQLGAILSASRAAADAASSGNRWSRAGTLLGGALVVGLIVCGAVIARHFPWLFTH